MKALVNTLKTPLLGSLIGRFIAASLLLLPVFIFISGALLIHSFKHSQLNAEQETLQAQLYLLLSSAEVENKRLLLPDVLTEPRFNQQNSGLYAGIYDENNRELWRSTSASLLNGSLNHGDRGFLLGNKEYVQQQIDTISLNQLSHDIEWLDDNNNAIRLRFIVASDDRSLRAEISSYQKQLWQWLSLLGLSLISVQILMMQWGLHPLKRLSRQLSALQNSQIQRLDSDYPREIQPVIESFNTILVYEKNQRERYRNTMSDLAHSLKTPLAVIQSHINNDNNEQHSLLSEQLSRINQIISHQLKRAVIRVNQGAISAQANKISIQAMVNRLIKILEKVYTDRQISFNNLVDEHSHYFGDEADLLEVMGNLLDNACKYGDNAIVISTSQDKHNLCIYISDNGKGLAPTQQTTLLQRGARGDTAQAGQGIGLSVAVDIISSYGGGLKVENNRGQPHLTGACFCITLPLNPATD